MRFLFILLTFPGFLMVSCSHPSPEVPEKKQDIPSKKITLRAELLNRIDAGSGLKLPTSLAEYKYGFLISDYETQRIFTFNKNGGRYFEFGKRGEGPGEFQKPICVSAANDSVLVYDTGRQTLLSFNSGATFKTQQRLSRPLSRVIAKNDKIYYSYYHIEGQPDIVIQNDSGETLKEISLKGASDKMYYATVAVDEDGTLYACALDKYSIEVYDANGTYISSFGRSFEQLPFVQVPQSRQSVGVIPVSGITFSKEYVFVLFGGHHDVYETYSGKTLDSPYFMRIDVFDKKGGIVSRFWPKDLPQKMVSLHHKPIFHLDKDHQLWIQNGQNLSTIHLYQLKGLE